MSAPDNDASPSPDLRIVRLLSREKDGDMQALVVIGTLAATRDERDLWVAIERDEPVELRAEDRHAQVEAARTLGAGELDRLGLAPADLEALQQALSDAPGHRAWLARFDVSDHRGLEAIWLRRAQASGEPEPIGVVAWLSTRRMERGPGEGSSCLVFTPQDTVARAAIAWADITSQKLFELGILFVHGIGPHRVRETLLHFGEPLVEFWLGLFRTLSRQSAQARGPEAVARLDHEARHRVLRARQDEDGAKKMFARYVGAAEGAKPAAAPLNDELCVAWLRTEDTLMGNEATDAPSASVMRLMRADAAGGLHDSHVLMAEAWWVNEAVRPSVRELLAWLGQAVPAALSVHVQALLDQRPGRRRTVAWCPGPDAGAGAAGTARVAFDGTVWIAKLLLLVPMYTAFVMVQRVTLGLIGVLALLPLPGLQRAAKAVLGTLMGTLGHSHALETSPVRRNAIVRRVVNQLDWLSDRCQRVAVVAHSQGAEVTRLAFQIRRRPEVSRWVTFGAGIKPLAVLERGWREDKALAELTRVIGWGAALGAVALLAGLVCAWPGLLPAAGSVRVAVALVGGVALARLASLVMVCSVLVVSLPVKPATPFRGRMSIMKVWRDYFASHDPVPGGSMLRDLEEDLCKWEPDVRPMEAEVHNTRLGVLDHTSYFDNVEQFVAPVAIDLLAQAGLAGNFDAVAKALRAAAERRAAYTWRHYVIRTLLIAAAAVVVLALGFGVVGEVPALMGEASSVMSGAGSFVDGMSALWRAGVSGRLAMSLWPLAVLGLALLVSGLDLARRRRASCATLNEELAAAFLTPAPKPGA